MSRILIVGVVLLVFIFPLKAQIKLSEDSQISVLTCGQGEELYAAFGHSAIRVTDTISKIDWVFNYGTFDFDTPWFYIKFANGNLDYLLSVSEYKGFLAQYFNDDRSVTEQVLNFDLDEKQRVFNALMLNYVPENRNYRYDFFYDNCATRIVDIIGDNLENDISFKPLELSESVSFRRLMHHYLHSSPWTETGLAMILGLPADKIANVRESAYLPYFLMKAFDQATITAKDGGKKPLVKEKIKILDFSQQNQLANASEILFYRYDFFYDNCATRIVDVINKNLETSISFKPFATSQNFSFRKLLHHYLQSSPWTETGIAMFLGLGADKAASVKESTYLPYYLMQAFAQATIKAKDGHEKPLVKEKATIVDIPQKSDGKVFTPVIFFWLLLLFSFGLIPFARKRVSRMFDGLLFFITGSVGLVIAFLWFISNHSVTGSNFNILWAMPTFILLAFFNLGKKIALYLLLLNLFCLLVFLIGWKLIPQAFPMATIPIALLLISRIILIFWQRKQTFFNFWRI